MIKTYKVKLIITTISYSFEAFYRLNHKKNKFFGIIGENL
jgi:hypothetical protein